MCSSPGSVTSTAATTAPGPPSLPMWETGRLRPSKVIGEPLDLVGAWEDADLAVVVDATRSGAAAGTVQLVDLGGGENADSYSGPMSTHGMDLARVLRLTRAMGHAPSRVVVVGIEGENFADGIGLSPAVEVAVPEAGELVLQVIDEAISCA